MKTIDCFGEICPLPLLKIEEELKKMQPGETFMLVTDHSCTIEHIRDKYEKRGLVRSLDEVMNGVWEVVLEKR